MSCLTAIPPAVLPHIAGRLRAALAVVAALAVLIGPLPALAQDIGTVASVEPQLTAASPGARARVLQMRSAVRANETVETGPTGRALLMFRDQSTLSLAPSTRITLDRFVYDPERRTGEMAVGLAAGALRFIGGQTSRSSDATIVTPGATLGIRGSSALVMHRAEGTVAVLIAGERMCLSGGQGRHCTSRRGGVVTEEGYQGVVNPAFLAFMVERIDGPPATPRGRPRDETGLARQAPPERQPLSSSGREQDSGVFDRSFTEDLLLRQAPPTPFQQAEDDPPVFSRPCVEITDFLNVIPFDAEFYEKELGFAPECLLF